MKANLVIGLYLLITLISYLQEGKCNTTTSLGVAEILPQSNDDKDNHDGFVSIDTILLLDDTSSIVLDTIKFDLYTGGKASHKLVLNNKSEKELPFNISVEYGPQNNYALEFNGLDGCVDCGNDSSLNISESITIEAWTYAYEWSRNRNILYKRTGGTYTLKYETDLDSLGLRIIGKSNRWRVFSRKPSEHAWHHIAAVSDYHLGKMAFYVDGYIINVKANISGKVSNNDSSLFIGCQGIKHFDIFRPDIWGGGMFYGFLDEVRLWKTARTKHQINEFMFAEIIEPEPDLVGYWKFNESRGNMAFDASVNNNDGILHGGVNYVRSTVPVKVSWVSVKPALNIKSQSVQELRISFDAQGLDAGEYFSKIIFSESDDSIQNIVVPMIIKVTRAPDIKVIIDTVHFDNCVIGNTVYQSLTIYNYGFDTLIINGIRSDNSDYNIKHTELSIPPYGSKETQIAYSPDLFGNSSCNVVILSNDPDQPQMSILFNAYKITIPGNTIVRWIIFAMLMIAIFVFLFIFSRYRLKQKSNIQLNKEVQIALKNQKKQQQIIIHQSRLTSLGQMASGIAHEVNQPLQNILLAAESIQMEMADINPDIHYIKNLVNEQYRDVDKISRISENINFFSDIDKENLEGKLNINQCIENAFSLMQKQYENHHIQAIFDLDEKIPEITGNSINFEQVIVNLLNNARDAVDEQGNQNTQDYQKKVEVVTGRQNSTIFIEVKDNGVGIPEEHSTNIFLPFFTTKALGSGTGLGLSISYRIINKMNGKINLLSKPGEGSTFKISLPVNE